MGHATIDHGGASRGTFKSYSTGFILSIVLTILAFAAVMSGILPQGAVLVVIFACAVAQILVHLHYFLHLDRASALSWNMLALIFTVLIMALFVGGTIWIMASLNERMM